MTRMKFENLYSEAWILWSDENGISDKSIKTFAEVKAGMKGTAEVKELIEFLRWAIRH